ncbi:hypothetical protein CSKR_104124 [Clonorchis sinensis]|uniref:Uncharacterized protein n=1 Tax=Clonorchis sinensis TaxID=79923 RepID=A0A3R7JI14_CLOSI|nr:hypothetical protein CSKR_104124 [Clonorchis sinensis]
MNSLRIRLCHPTTRVKLTIYLLLSLQVKGRRPSLRSCLFENTNLTRRKADLRKDVLLTCLISSIHRYTGILL